MTTPNNKYNIVKISKRQIEDLYKAGGKMKGMQVQRYKLDNHMNTSAIRIYTRTEQLVVYDFYRVFSNNVHLKLVHI